ncbi:hypothetical protein [Ramlibacter sp. PS4R-6]|uniref:hypothetical protein n=1 Tax=Ramlibacter sp. PS4R-6 TaxID=3133438 RepID=UPI0030B77755
MGISNDNKTIAIKPSNLGRLQQRAFGGEDVAARPNFADDAWWPTGELLPGVSELIDDALTNEGRREGLTAYFLLGGAGNGKSFAIRQLTARLGIELPTSDRLARRLHQAHRKDADFVLLNDATIAPLTDYPKTQNVALASDLTAWWKRSAKKPVVAFCGVNRGILVDELKELAQTGAPINKLSTEVLRWLANPNYPIATHMGAPLLHDDSISVRANCHEVKMIVGGRQMRLVALAVDASSLFEVPPNGGPARAAALITQVVDRCAPEGAQRDRLCPIRANLEQLSGTHGIDRWAAAIASAEIAAGKFFSYRDVWGLVALSVLGSRVAPDGEGGAALDIVDQLLRSVDKAQTTWDRLRNLLDLSRFRMHNALYRAPIPRTREAEAWYPPSTPVHSGLALVDPSAWRTRDSSAIEAGMQSIAMGERPSETASCRELLAGVWSPFDRALESALLAFIETDECSDAARRRLISWLGGYMLRLAATGSGSLGNEQAIHQWRACEQSARSNTALPIRFSEAIRALLYPNQEGSPPHNVALPAFSARAEPIRMRAHGREPTLARLFDYSPIALRIVHLGVRPVIECFLAGTNTVVGQLTLDFALVRETLACQEERAGQTESTAFVEARLERCRAASLDALPEAHARLVGLLGAAHVELGV